MAGRPKRRARLAAVQGGDPVTKFDAARSPERIAQQAVIKKPRDVQRTPKSAALSVGAHGEALYAPKKMPESDDTAAADAMIAAMIDDQSGALKELLGLVIQHNIDVMKMPLPDEYDKNFGAVLRVKQQIAASVMTVVTRTNDSILRGQGSDKFAELLNEVRAEAANGHGLSHGTNGINPGGIAEEGVVESGEDWVVGGDADDASSVGEFDDSDEAALFA